MNTLEADPVRSILPRRSLTTAHFHPATHPAKLTKVLPQPFLPLASCPSPQLSLARLHRPSPPKYDGVDTAPLFAAAAAPASSPRLAPLTTPPPAAPSASSPMHEYRRRRLLQIRTLPSPALSSAVLKRGHPALGSKEDMKNGRTFTPASSPLPLSLPPLQHRALALPPSSPHPYPRSAFPTAAAHLLPRVRGHRALRVPAKRTCFLPIPSPHAHPLPSFPPSTRSLVPSRLTAPPSPSPFPASALVYSAAQRTCTRGERTWAHRAHLPIPILPLFPLPFPPRSHHTPLARLAASPSPPPFPASAPPLCIPPHNAPAPTRVHLALCAGCCLRALAPTLGTNSVRVQTSLPRVPRVRRVSAHMCTRTESARLVQYPPYRRRRTLCPLLPLPPSPSSPLVPLVPLVPRPFPSLFPRSVSSRYVSVVVLVPHVRLRVHRRTTHPRQVGCTRHHVPDIVVRVDSSHAPTHTRARAERVCAGRASVGAAAYSRGAPLPAPSPHTHTLPSPPVLPLPSSPSSYRTCTHTPPHTAYS
ncbi:hypothetical protein B0H16DRAFT_1897049 [Mycena metata]|uniref:Uncharacterized protein n=1 Tax=Mycena metata TaxID=1033252 RepID=A0AAD7HGK3_9AGAR|nr:hypothetical protein B0H16DRAFT_1897049 [Mycena metata]